MIDVAGLALRRRIHFEHPGVFLFSQVGGDKGGNLRNPNPDIENTFPSHRGFELSRWGHSGSMVLLSELMWQACIVSAKALESLFSPFQTTSEDSLWKERDFHRP